MSGVRERGDVERWTPERARDWWSRRPLPVGCNFIPSTAINQLEMWQAVSFDEETIRRELGWAGELGFNSVRVYLHDLLWDQDSGGFLKRVESFLAAASDAGISTILVLFDDVWNPEPRPGPQPEPVAGRHNSQWVASPGRAALAAYPGDSATRDRLERYVRGVISHFAQDERVSIWDLYNEPGGYPSPRSQPVGEACVPLLRDAFDWARDVSPSQPLTSGLWWNPVNPLPQAIEQLLRDRSDIVSFHHYGPVDELRELCLRLRSETDRPLLCTEYLARHLESRFESHLPLFRELAIGAISWGLVSGRTQTIHPWWSWFKDEARSEPRVWFHDILRSDGSAFDEAEVTFLRSHLLGAGREPLRVDEE